MVSGDLFKSTKGDPLIENSSEARRRGDGFGGINAGSATKRSTSEAGRSFKGGIETHNPNIGFPLADRLRPRSLGDVYGQDHLLGPCGALTKLMALPVLPSLILWGPAGTGKTTTARLLAGQSSAFFEQISAIQSGVQDLKKRFQQAKDRLQLGQRTVLFVDEIHRFNRSQQDSFLPVVEDGTIILIGATTENPSFELNGALLSRMQVLVLKALDTTALNLVLTRAEALLKCPLPVTSNARRVLLSMAGGDGRYLLTLAETLWHVKGEDGALIDQTELVSLVNARAPTYDKSGDEHYNLISALHKSLRGSDVDAALYWFARMQAGGEHPHYILRRLVRFASEDIGMADPAALSQVLSAKEAYDFLGSPEGDLALVQAVIYLATAPKSNAVYKAGKSAALLANKRGSLPPPASILNAPTQMMKDIGYGQGYIYDHDTKSGFSGQCFFPDDLVRTVLYHPVERGFERDIKKRLAYWQKLRGTFNASDFDAMDKSAYSHVSNNPDEQDASEKPDKSDIFRAD